jgi:hypothetical protein
MASMLQPRAPLARWPLQLVMEESGVFAWYSNPATLINQVYVPHVKAEGFRQWALLVDGLMEVKAKEIAEAGGLLIINDWREIRTFDAGMSTFFSERAKKVRPGTLRGSLVAMQTLPLLKMGFQTVSLHAMLNPGHAPVRPIKDVFGAMVDHGVQVPQRGQKFPDLPVMPR